MYDKSTRFFDEVKYLGEEYAALPEIETIKINQKRTSAAAIKPTMAIALCFTPLFCHQKQSIPPKPPLHKPFNNPITICSRRSRHSTNLSTRCSVNSNPESLAAVDKPRLEEWLSAAASLYPVYVTVGGVLAFIRPSTFSFFVNMAPNSYSFTLGLIMLSMGITLEFKELIDLFRQRPLSILYGCAAQYTIMPSFGWIVSKLLGLSPSLTVGLILLSCCPGGTASNVVTLIARGDVPLSIVMTVCTTLGAVILTPLLTKILAGTFVPVNAASLSMSTLQVVVAPILLGSYLQSKFPEFVKLLIPFSPLVAVIASSLLASSVFSENVIRLKSSFAASSSSASSLVDSAKSMLSSELGAVVLSVILLHLAGFFVGYLSAALGGFKEPQRRAISIEVGMQNSSLGVVLATSHFASPLVALPSAMSAVLMNIMGSSLGFFWRYIDPSNQKDGLEVAEE
ncbi:probable sodium/metabolite cotransporter BASS1, chloroplastic [Salvia hispanica]|uniref:probable sodium/metabolite cotransporter BASS1, chloroplastic n=1 Tax=Salvia hispanica TaxID=49212 RepID=UPI0020094469|nr:probable sodium/metabolite cotransporter BASS1, chloroplastic [Salvia hispanica]XP_047976473.1 probable sodium/metabolite cotransporter BASS1, chloroplastic [Salvia hispanica]XP_047976474.1 probable sodium/metabolite cotransporter BASS1, chloroplastic [Salvia hispanica]